MNNISFYNAEILNKILYDFIGFFKKKLEILKYTLEIFIYIKLTNYILLGNIFKLRLVVQAYKSNHSAG